MSDNNSLYSMDKLVEFGMGMAVAKQMTSAMNEMLENSMQQVKGVTFKNVQMPTQNQFKAAPVSQLFYTVFDGKQAGPFSESEIARLVNEKKLTKETLVWTQGMGEWQKAEDVPQVLKLIALCPPPINN